MLQEFLLPATLGKNPASVGQALSLYAHVRGNNMAKAGLEAALWDVFAKAGAMSLSKMLGGEKNSIEVGVSIGIQPTISALLHTIEDSMAKGYRRVKIKIAPGSDCALVDAVRGEWTILEMQLDDWE